MGILECVKDRFHYTRKFTIFVLLFWFIVLVILFLISPIDKLYIFISNLALLMIIAIWIYTAPKIYSDIEALNNIFSNNLEYKNKYDEYIRNLKLFPDKNDKGWTKLLKGLYNILWMVLLLFLPFALYKLNLLSKNLESIVYCIFLIVAVILNYSSYYTCMVLAYFIRSLSQLNSLEYNIFLPSATWQFIKLKKNVDKISIIFLVVVLLFSVSYINLFLSVYSLESLNNAIKLNIEWLKQLKSLFLDYETFVLFLVLSFIFLFFGILSFFILFFLPKLFLYRIHYKWKEESLKKFQEELDKAVNNNNLQQEIVKKIERLHKDNIGIGLANMIEVTLIITTIIYNIYNVG